MSKDLVNFEQVARDVCRGVGYTSEEVGLDCNTMNVILNIQEQSWQIADAVHTSKNEEDFGAGD